MKILLFQNNFVISRLKSKPTTTMKTNLKYTKKFINQNFRMKVYGFDESGKRINKLVGVAGLIALIGIEFINKFIDRALKAGLDCCKCKLRRGLQVSFYVK